MRGNILGSKTLRAIALKALEGVGDEITGQWEEYTGKAFHVRRRLTNEEQKPIGVAVDVRGTPEAIHRINAIRIVMPFLPREMLEAEIYGERLPN
jgi:hypothetical protein